MKCIFCLEEKDSTVEHIIPESIGGSLTIDSVCKDCNSFIGAKIDGIYINSLLVSLPRFQFNIVGKSGKSSNPFKGIGITEENVKVRVDENLKPYIIPSVHEETLPDGSTFVKMSFDQADEHKVKDEVLKKIKRMIKAKYPEKKEDEVEEDANRVILNSVKGSSNPSITYKFLIDLVPLRLEYLKIAYEMAFFLFGYDYIEHSDTAKKIRDSIMGLMKEPLVRGQIPCESDDMEKLFTEPDKHFIFITGKGMYIRLFNISGFVNYEETNSKFMLEQEKYELFTIDYVNKRWNRERFIDRLAKTMRFV